MPEHLVHPARLGTLAPADLAAVIRPLWEDAGPLTIALAGVEVSSWEEHVDRAEAAIAAMDDPTRARLLAAHPRIGAAPEHLAATSVASWREQGGAAPVEVTTAARLDHLNDAYETRFGFPFVEWVAGRSRAEMIPVIEARLEADRAAELAAGCAALVAIARDRLAHLRSETR